MSRLAMPSMRRSPFADAGQRFLAGRFGLWLFLASLGMLFGATLIAFLVLRLQIGANWPVLPSLPGILWLSTAVILASSATMQMAVYAAGRNRAPIMRSAMMLTLALGFVFLILQSIAWLQWIPAAVERWDDSNEWRFALTAFYVFTSVHAAHVIGGLIPMAVIAYRSCTLRDVFARQAGVQYCAMYWHFLAAVWIALFATLMIGV